MSWDDYLEAKEIEMENEINNVSEMPNVQVGAPYDHKLLFLSLLLISEMGPTVQITFIMAIVLFFLSG